MYQGDDVGWLIVQAVGDLFVVCDEMGNVDVAIILLGKDIFPYLISLDECAAEVEVEQKIDKLILDGAARV